MKFNMETIYGRLVRLFQELLLTEPAELDANAAR